MNICNVYVFYRIGSDGEVPVKKYDIREIKPKPQKSQNVAPYKVKRHPTTVDNVSTFCIAHGHLTRRKMELFVLRQLGSFALYIPEH